MDKCVYAPPQKSEQENRTEKLQIPSSSTSVFALSPSVSSSSLSGKSPSILASPFATTPNFNLDFDFDLDFNFSSDTSEFDFASSNSPGLSNMELYRHYIQHTNRTLSLYQNDSSILHIDIPALAQQSQMIYHSLLAVSAISVAWMMIYRNMSSDVETVREALLTGYQHYNIASKSMRDAIASPDASKQEPLVASVVLVPFAAASQQIEQWISSHPDTEEPNKLLMSTPRDIIVIMQGIRSMLYSLSYIDLSSRDNLTHPSLTQNPSRTHMLSEIFASTSAAAFATLARRLDSIEPHEGLSAAFATLCDIRRSTLSTSPLHFSASVSAHPNDPLTREFLTFLSEAPASYLDLVLPLLEKRLASPVPASPVELTKQQALALDIYAHWSVLMVLVEEETWWIGKLPIVTLRGMVNRYGEGFVGRLWGEEDDKWWPSRMLGIWSDVDRYR